MEQRLCFKQRWKGHVEVVRFLVESGANTDQGGCLCILAAQGHIEVVRFLVESGANKDQCMEQRLCA